MPHNPLKSIKIDFHDANGVTAKPQALPQAASSDPAGTPRSGMDKQPVPQQTSLSPMEEALFPHWMRANGIDPEGVDDHAYDYRGVYRQTNGQVHPPGTISKIANTINTLHTTRHPAIQGMMDMAPSHSSGFTTPGSPDMGSALANKSSIMQQEQDQSNSDPIRSLINLIGLGR